MKIRKRNVNEYDGTDENQNEVTQLLRRIEAAFSLLCKLPDHNCQAQ